MPKYQIGECRERRKVAPVSVDCGSEGTIPLFCKTKPRFMQALPVTASAIALQTDIDTISELRNSNSDRPTLGRWRRLKHSKCQISMYQPRGPCAHYSGAAACARTLGRTGVFGTTGHSAPSRGAALSARYAGSQFAVSVPPGRHDPSVLPGSGMSVGSTNPD